MRAEGTVQTNSEAYLHAMLKTSTDERLKQALRGGRAGHHRRGQADDVAAADAQGQARRAVLHDRGVKGQPGLLLRVFAKTARSV